MAEARGRCRSARAALLVLLLLLLTAAVGASGGATRWDWLPAPYDAGPLLEKAAAGGGDEFTFAVFGDSYAVPALTGLLKLVDARHPTFAVTVGDMVASGGRPRDDAEWRNLSDRVGWFMRAYPTWAVIGNHEVSGGYESGVASYLSFYHLPEQNYSFTFGNSKFIVLGVDADERPAPADQIEFVKRETADRDRYAHLFVFRHYPFYTVGEKSKEEVPNTETPLVKLFRAARVTAVFSGHDHIYYRTKRGGLAYLISGGAGAGIYPLRRASERLRDDVYMGRATTGGGSLLHSPGKSDRRWTGPEDRDLFAVFIHVNGQAVTGEMVSVTRETWDRFSIGSGRAKRPGLIPTAAGGASAPAGR
jgi:hypothetical protein